MTLRNNYTTSCGETLKKLYSIKMTPPAVTPPAVTPPAVTPAVQAKDFCWIHALSLSFAYTALYNILLRFRFEHF